MVHTCTQCGRAHTPRHAVEADGEYWHTSPNGRIRGARRDAALMSLGITTIRITGSEVHLADDVTKLVSDRLTPYLQISA